MATTVTKTIKASGGDYSTIAAWEAATDTDLVAADEVQVGELFDKTGAWDERVTIAGATTDSTRFRRLICPSGERHNGTGDGSGATIIPTSSGHVFTISEDYFHAQYLDISAWVGGSSEAFRVTGDNFKLSHSLIHDGTDNAQDGVYPGSNSLTIFIWNTAFWNIGRVAVHIQGRQSLTIYVYSCAGWDIMTGNFGADHPGFGADSGENNNGSVMHCKNVTSHTGNASARDAFHGGGTAGNEATIECTNCGAHDTSITTGGDVTNNGGEQESLVQADQFVSLSGTIDLHTKSGADLLLNGVDLSADANLSFDDDFDGVTRTGTWDIGADQFSAAGGNAMPMAQNHYRRRRVG